jgi:ankyrin repeat protein
LILKIIHPLNWRGELRKAAFNNRLEALKEFIQLVNTINAKDPKQGKTALHFAVSKGHLECVKELLSAGADPVVKDASEKAPGDYTSNEEILRILRTRQKAAAVYWV